MNTSLSAEEIFHAARAKSDPAERARFLQGACRDDKSVRAEVESLLKADANAGCFLTEGTTGGDPDATMRRVVDARSFRATDAGQFERASETIGRYTLLEPIGEGGFGSVWMAEQREPVKRRVALKIIKLGMDTRQVIARFEAERQALAMMDHPNIAKVLDAGATDAGRPYFVMELCPGDSITEYCDRHNLAIRERLELFAQVCQAVQHAHQKGLIHRDIKPSNILVNAQDGRSHAKVIDFGIAKATASKLTEKTLFTELQQLIGTPQYMSPEQAEGSLDIDTRTDVYSLGVLLYELLTGTTPFDPKSLRSAAYAEIQRIIREVEPPKPSTRLSQNSDAIASIAARRRTEPRRLGTFIRGDLDWITLKAMDKDRTRRYETANALAMDIIRYLRNEPVTAGPPGAGYRLRKFVQRNRVGVAAGTLLAAALVLGVIGTTGGLIWALDERSRANDQAAKAVIAAESEARARVAAQENEQQAIAAAKVAEESRGAEAKARKRAETISEFVAAALRTSDAQTAGREGGADGAGRDMTVLAAMENAIKDIDSGRFADDPETEAALRGTIGVILFNNGQYARAKPLLEQALATRERLFATDHLIVADTAHRLSKLYASQGRFADAEPLCKRVLAIREQALGPDHPDVAKVLSNLSAMYVAQGQYAQAEPLISRALSIRERALGPDHAEVARSLGDLGFLHRRQGRYAEAEPLLKRSLAIHESVFGPKHPDVAHSLNILAMLYHSQSRYAEAEPLMTRALSIRENTLGPDHPGVAESLNNLAALYVAQGRHTEAEPLLMRSLAIREKTLGPSHASVAQSLNALASIHKAQGRHAEAESLYKRSLAIFEKALGAEHPDVAQCLSNLATLYYEQSQYAEAEPLYRRALAIREQVLGADHPDVANGLNNLATLYRDQGLYTQAEPLFARALEINAKVLGPDHPNLAQYRATLATCRARLPATSAPVDMHATETPDEP